MKTGRRRKRTTDGVPVAAVVGIAVAAALALLSVVLASNGGDGDGSVEVRGQSLPVFQPDAPDDDAVGQPAPVVTGEDFDGESVSIDYTSETTVVLFLTHWCPACQQEAPIVQEVVDDGGVADGVEVVSVSTGVDRARDNYPPQRWLEAIGWTPPVVTDVDDQVAAAFGLSVYPYWVVVDGDGEVTARYGYLDEPHVRRVLAGETITGR